MSKWLQQSFSYPTKSDTCRRVFNLNFNDQILSLILIGYTHGPSKLKQIVGNTVLIVQKTVLNSNSNFRWKTVLNVAQF